jgi:8-oxo-dGTP diphosphatase
MINPKIGIGVFVIKDNRILFGKRKNSLGDGNWSLPGGKLEMNEQIEECAKREVLEETGINIKNIRLITFTNDIFKEEKEHYVTIFVIADYDSGEVILLGPEKCEKWEWVEWNNLPQPLFLPIQNFLKQGFNPLISR